MIAATTRHAAQSIHNPRRFLLLSALNPLLLRQVFIYIRVFLGSQYFGAYESFNPSYYVRSSSTAKQNVELVKPYCSVSIPLTTSGLHLLTIGTRRYSSRLEKVSIPLITSGLHLHSNRVASDCRCPYYFVSIPLNTPGLHLLHVGHVHVCHQSLQVSIPLITSGLHLLIRLKQLTQQFRLSFQSLLLRQVFIYQAAPERTRPFPPELCRTVSFQSLLLRQVFIYTYHNMYKIYAGGKTNFNPSYYVRSSSTCLRICKLGKVSGNISIPLITSGLHLPTCLRICKLGKVSGNISIPLITSGLHLRCSIGMKLPNTRLRIFQSLLLRQVFIYSARSNVILKKLKFKKVSIPLITSGLHLRKERQRAYGSRFVSIPLITSGLHLPLEAENAALKTSKFQSLLLRQVFIYVRHHLVP